jgi:hypothetical protein
LAQQSPGAPKTKKKQEKQDATPADAVAAPGLAVREMLEALRQAIVTGRIDELRHAVELNEVKPDVGAVAGKDVVAHLKAKSTDGEGYDVLATLALLLETKPQLLPLGRDLENNRVWLWPGFAETPLGKLTPAEEVELRKLVRGPALEAMRKDGKYKGPRLVIGQDGVWHTLLID